MEAVIARRTDRIQVVLEDIYQPHNASAVMRSCECFGIQNLHVIENRYEYTVNRDVAMGSSKWITLHRYREEAADNTKTCMEALRQKGFRIVATSLDPGSVPLDEFSLDENTSLWFGTEEEGLSQTVLESADEHVHIPMDGFTQSFNISVSAALCLYELRRKLVQGDLPWQLSESRKNEIYRLWLRNIVKNADILERGFLKENLPQ
ncbi:RNA methyltransferase [Puniceicoccales bacterium CK1056]|uniref:tRNA (guanosine(18)-2'-O)-methyltransferase n=2 Tax=Oceanipulchritudo coccoides TaxID=2706888 RepID=A0A6B2M0P7_9BACT|nr:RNA methyltransferase [Oceanipulchritudo coccoides]